MRVRLSRHPDSAYCKDSINFPYYASPDDAGHHMQPDQHQLSPDCHHYAVHYLIPLYSLLVNKVENDGVNPRRGHVSSKLLGLILSANRPIKICYHSRCIYL